MVSFWYNASIFGQSTQHGRVPEIFKLSCFPSPLPEQDQVNDKSFRCFAGMNGSRPPVLCRHWITLCLRICFLFAGVASTNRKACTYWKVGAGLYLALSVSWWQWQTAITYDHRLTEKFCFYGHLVQWRCYQCGADERIMLVSLWTVETEFCN